MDNLNAEMLQKEISACVKAKLNLLAKSCVVSRSNTAVASRCASRGNEVQLCGCVYSSGNICTGSFWCCWCSRISSPMPRPRLLCRLPMMTHLYRDPEDKDLGSPSWVSRFWCQVAMLVVPSTSKIRCRWEPWRMPSQWVNLWGCRMRGK